MFTTENRVGVGARNVAGNDNRRGNVGGSQSARIAATNLGGRENVGGGQPARTSHINLGADTNRQQPVSGNHVHVPVGGIPARDTRDGFTYGPPRNEYVRENPNRPTRFTRPFFFSARFPRERVYYYPTPYTQFRSVDSATIFVEIDEKYDYVVLKSPHYDKIATVAKTILAVSFVFLLIGFIFLNPPLVSTGFSLLGISLVTALFNEILNKKMVKRPED